MNVTDSSSYGPGSDGRLTAPADASNLDLLRTFEPVVRFTHGEQFFPIDVERYVARSSLWVHYPDGSEEELISEGNLDISKLVESREYPFGTVEFLRFNEPLSVAEGARILAEVGRLRKETGNVFHPGLGRLARGRFTARVADALFSLSLLLRGKVSRVTAAAAELDYYRILADEEKYVYYGRVIRQGGWTVLQYWFFYCYNSWRSGFQGVNDHESDWENILVYLYEQDGRLSPEWAAYASHDFHGADLRRRWDDHEQLDLVDGHPVVWAGAGSHASYFQQGEYQAAVSLPLPKFVHSIARSMNRFWTRTLGQAGREKDPLRIPFVDYARGDGKSIGPGQELGWSPVVIDESTPWVGQYRGLWGLFANDPISGENAPAGPMYDRDGSPRGAWYDPLGFAGLDNEPPPPAAISLIEHDCVRIERRRSEIDTLVESKVAELHALGVGLAGMKGNPHLYGRYTALSEERRALGEEVKDLRKERSENEALLSALRQRLSRLQSGTRDDPRAHILSLAQPVAPAEMRFNRAAETWSVVSISIVLLGIVALIALAREYLWVGLLVMVVTLIVVESILRGEYTRTITGIAAVLTVISIVLLVVHFWLWVIVGVLVGLAFFLLVQKLRELRG